VEGLFLTFLSQDAEDHDLVKAIAGGDSHALSMLYTRHGLRLLSYLIGQLDDAQLAEEVLQDVMLAVWKNAAGFRGDSRVTTWLLSIARHRAINAHHKRQSPHQTTQQPFDESLDRLVQSAMDNHEGIQEAIDCLPPSQQETLELVFYHNLTGTEAAQVLKVPVGTIKSRLHRALTTLRRLLVKEGINHE
jgi:RNA polymerase sigma-70 factor, ECF subfamily